MISYILNRKGKTILCEDSLTSSIFDLLKYLPIEQFWKILKNSVFTDKLPFSPGDIKDIIFWDKWNPNGTNNINFIEPDLFIRFNEFDMILEAKRKNEKQQKSSQNVDQIISYYNSFEEENKILYYIQVAGLFDKIDIDHEKAIILKTDWSRLQDAVIAEYEMIQSINMMNINSSKRILKDIMQLFELHQFYKKKWLKDFTIDNPIDIKKYTNNMII